VQQDLRVPLAHPLQQRKGERRAQAVGGQADLTEAIAASRRRTDAEAGFIAAYRSGGTVAEICNLAPVLAAKGVVINE
jgi:4-hydroxy-4-methyl-2-oxoglutarate aldolase